MGGKKKRKVLSLQNLHIKPVMFKLILLNLGWHGQSQTPYSAGFNAIRR